MEISNYYNELPSPPPHYTVHIQSKVVGPAASINIDDFSRATWTTTYQISIYSNFRNWL